MIEYRRRLKYFGERFRAGIRYRERLVRRTELHAALWEAVGHLLGRPRHQPSNTIINPVRVNREPMVAGAKVPLIASA